MYKKLSQLTRLVAIASLIIIISSVYTQSFGAAIDPIPLTYTCTGTSPSGGDDSYTTDEDNPITVSDPGVLVNDCDDYATDDVLEVDSVTDTTTGLLTITAGPGNGGFDYNPDGQFESLAAGESTTDSFTYEATDGVTTSPTHTVTITIDGLNDAPTDISLSSTSIAENLASGSAVGTLTSADLDASDTHVYTLVAGAGDNDNGSFSIVGDALQSAELFDFETKNSYSIRVQTDDGNSGTFDKQFTISIADTNDPPSDISLSSTSINENLSVGSLVGNLSTTDQDTSDTHIYSLVAGTGDDDNGSFLISGDALQSAEVFDFETKNSYSIRIQTDDGNGGLFEKQFTITITDVNDPPEVQNPIPDQNAHQGNLFNFSFASDTFFDADGDPLTFSALKSDDSPLPDWLTFDPGTRIFSGTPGFIDSGLLSIKVTANDGNGGTVSDFFDIILNGVIFTPSADLTTTEGGGQQAINVELSTQPTLTVAIGLTSNDTTEGTVSPTVLIFDDTNWDQQQLLLIDGVDDDIIDGDMPYVILTSIATSDPVYTLVDPPDLSVTNEDDDVAGFTIIPNSGLITSEDGSTAEFTIELDTKPEANVTVTLFSDDTSEGTVSPTSVTFTPANWDSPKTITITGEDDDIADGDKPYSIVTDPAVSSDMDYSGLDPDDVQVTNSDLDTAGYTTPPLTGWVTTEGEESAFINIIIKTKPQESVTFDFISSDTSEGIINSPGFSLNPIDWMQNETIKIQVTGVDDKLADGDKPYTVTFIAMSDDPDYDEQFEFHLTNIDTPTVKWVEPVNTGGIFTIKNLNPILLRCEKDGGEPIDFVSFYYWDVVAKQEVKIGEVYDPPYEIYFDPAPLAMGFNQVYCYAFGPTNLSSQVRRSNLKHIWIERLQTEYQIHMPLINK